MIPYSTSTDIIYQVARQLNSSLDLDEVLGKVLTLTVEATGAERGTLFLLNNDGQVTRQIQSDPHKPPEVVYKNIEIAMSHGLAGWVYRHQHGALATNTATDERWITLPDSTRTTGSALVVPLLRQDIVNGVLALHHSQVRFFDESHLALVAGIASQAAVAVENARLFTQIRNEREGLYTLINAMPNPVLEISPDSEIVFANQAAKQSLLIKEANIALSAIEGGDRLKLALEEMHSRAVKQVEVRWPDDRVFNVSINAVPQLGTVVTLDDITHLKELENIKSQFVATVSHDLKSPLTVVMGFADVLKSEPNLSEIAQTGVDSILHNAAHMRDLIEELLDLAKIEAGIEEEPEPVDITIIVEDVVANHTFQAKTKELDLTLNLPTTTPLVFGQELRLAQVVDNLITNAIKYTPQGGQIDVTMSCSDSEVLLQVSDTGFGIPPAAQSQLFQKFYRVPEIHTNHTEIEGTGLGLSIVKAIVEMYGGRVWVESEVGTGSTFSCLLPTLPVQAKACNDAD